MSIREKLAGFGFAEIDEQSVGPLLIIRLGLEKSKLEEAVRLLERKLRLAVKGFRLGRCPISHLYSHHKRAIDTALFEDLKKRPPKALSGALSQAVIPPEFIVLPWDGHGSLLLEVKCLNHPSMPNPASHLEKIMRAGETSSLESPVPQLPQPGAHLPHINAHGSPNVSAVSCPATRVSAQTNAMLPSGQVPTRPTPANFASIPAPGR